MKSVGQENGLTKKGGNRDFCEDKAKRFFQKRDFKKKIKKIIKRKGTVEKKNKWNNKKGDKGVEMVVFLADG